MSAPKQKTIKQLPIKQRKVIDLFNTVEETPLSFEQGARFKLREVITNEEYKPIENEATPVMLQNDLNNRWDSEEVLPERLPLQENATTLDELKGMLRQALNLASSLPYNERIKLLDDLKPDFASLRTPPIPPLPEPDTTGTSYSLYVRRTDPMEHLKNVWGKWLKCFNEELDRDFLTQNDLRKLDPTLYAAVRNYLNTKTEIPFSDIVSPSQ